MKKNISIILVLLVIIIFLFANVNATKSLDNTKTDNTIRQIYEFEKPEITKFKGYDVVNLPDALNLGEPGTPSLPIKPVKLLLPFETEIDDVNVIKGEKISLGKNFLVMPNQEYQPISSKEKTRFVEPEKEIYKKNNVYPNKVYDNEITQYLSGHSIGILNLYPVEYIPETGELFYYKTLTVEIKTKESNKAKKSSYFLKSSAQNKIKELIDNPEYSNEYRYYNTLGEDDYDYLIITHNSLVDEFQVLADYKNKQGYKTKIMTTALINFMYDDDDSQEEIRHYIQDEYINHDIEYVLLAGDDEYIPHRGFWVSAGGSQEYDLPSDLYYAGLDGTWNDDNDNKWGEDNEADYLAEVYIGRAAVFTDIEAENFVNKQIMYQQTPVITDLEKTLMVGEQLDDYTWGGNYKNEIINGASTNGLITEGFPDNFNIQTLYDMNYGYYGWSTNDLFNILDNGMHIINHLGHSNPNYNLKLYLSGVNNNNFINNGINHNYLIIYSQGCISAAFDEYDCMAEKFTNIENAAVAYIGNTRYGWYSPASTDGPSQYFDRIFFDILFKDESFTTPLNLVKKYIIGVAEQESKHKLVSYNYDSYMRWVYYELTLFGDPTFDIWTEEPETLNVDHESTIELGATEFDVYVEDEIAALVGVYKDGILYGSAYTKNTGDNWMQAEVEFDDPIQDYGDLDITVSKHNFLPYTESVTVIDSEYCSDGTEYGECSDIPPLFCDNGDLVNNCQQCGCPISKTCLDSGKCTWIAIQKWRGEETETTG